MRSKSRVPTKVTHYRPLVEALERRIAPAGVNPFTNLANQL